jgi:protein-tyrosine phosphatase
MIKNKTPHPFVIIPSNLPYGSMWSESQKSFHPSEILPGLFIGSNRNASDKKKLDELGIKKILNMTIECSNHYPDLFEYKKIMLNDSVEQQLEPYLDDAIKFIEEAMVNKVPILVHCYAGISRSTTVVIAYLCSTGMTLKKAVTLVKEKRPEIEPNVGFYKHLMIREYKFTGKCSIDAPEYAPLICDIISSIKPTVVIHDIMEPLESDTHDNLFDFVSYSSPHTYNSPICNITSFPVSPTIR